MRHDLVNLFRCPRCRAPLRLLHETRGFDLRGARHVVDGVLVCESDHRWPILEEVPRLLLEPLMTREEIAFLGSASSSNGPVSIVPTILTDREIEMEIARTVREGYGASPEVSAAARRRADREVEYAIAEFNGLNKRKYVPLVEGRLTSRPDRLLDVGGDLGATGRCFSRALGARDTIVVDLNIGNQHAFKSADRGLCLVRADAQNLPFPDRAFDLVVSAFLLEHVPDWRRAASEMMRVGGACFIAFGPNRWFPYEMGHIDAPLAGTLPKPLAKYVAFAWLWLTRQGRTLKRIEESLAEVTFISSVSFRRHCRRESRSPVNLLPRLVEAVIQDRQAPPTPLRRLVRRLGAVAPLCAGALAGAGLEPQMYYFIPPPQATMAAGHIEPVRSSAGR
jgi:uncharacterized protein YbaR (Trm112 family)